MKKLLLFITALLPMFVCSSAYGLDKVNGVYQIGTAQDFRDFAEIVNDGEFTANAVLTADIDKGTDATMIGRDGLDYQGTFDGCGHTITINMFSSGEQATAIFRNTGIHAIVQNLKVVGTITTNQKLAAGISSWNSGIIRNCYVDVTVKSSFTGDASHGGIAAVAYGGTFIENCLVKFVIKGVTTRNCGGVIGFASGPVNIANCLVISDGSSFDLSNNGSNDIARNDENVRVVDLSKYLADSYTNRPKGANFNNYVTNKWGDNKATTVVPYADLADGKICYQLNNDQSRIAWVQRIGTDPFPVPAAFGSGQVYASGATDCKGTSTDALTYSNTPGDAVVSKHEFDEYGICTSCGCFDFHMFEFDNPTKFDQSDRSILLRSVDDIRLAEGWNRITNGIGLNMKMANDIEYIAEPGNYIFNPSDWVSGDFNGDGHVLTIEMSEMGDYASFLPKMTGIFENVIMHGSISTNGRYAASVTSHTYKDKVIIRNVFSDIEINSSKEGDNTSAGIVGVAESKTQLENVIYSGNINLQPSGNRVAGIVGWASGLTSLTNCAFLGTINNAMYDGSNTISRNPTNVYCENVYSLNDYGFGDNDKFILLENGQESVTNGELAFLLNAYQQGCGNFYQKIGEDLMPMPIKKEGALVYANASEYRCDGFPLGETIYSNTYPVGQFVPDHQYDEGFCTVCGGIQEDFMTPVDGWFEISNGAELVWWSNYASTHLDASAKLTADIDLENYNETDPETGRSITSRYAQVGSEYKPFFGNFDGQCHTISNLNINLLGKRGCGLISVMNSQPDDQLGGLSADAARAAEGVYVKDVVLDETCSITGGGYTGIVGMGSPWAGHITITGCMNLGNVYVVSGTNGAGIYGCSMGSACRVTINACGMIGDIHVENDTRTENGSFSGWLGNYAEVTNCFALGTVDYKDADRGFARHPNSAQVIVKNCYAMDGVGMVQNNHDGSKEDVSFVTKEDLKTGKITWKANGSQFREPVWYQTIGEDDYPFANPSHGTIIYVAEQYFSVTDVNELGDIATAMQNYEEMAVNGTIVTRELYDEYMVMLEALNDATSIIEFADVVDSINVKKAAVADNAAVYNAYLDKCEEVKASLEVDQSFSGLQRAALEYYLSRLDEPDDYNTHGTYEYIKKTHTATAEEIAAETERVSKWLVDAIAEAYVPGTDVSNLISNYDFTKKNENWIGGWLTDLGKSQGKTGKIYSGVEGWNVTGDMYQTVENMKPGYYLIGVNGAFCPSDNRYSTNYAAGIYANGVFNYFPSIYEDYIAVADAVDQENCNLHGAGVHDIAIYNDGASISDNENAEIIGYAVHGETGMAIAAKAGRYQVYTIAHVGEDGKLTIGIKNPGTKYGNDWTGWSALKVIYCGDKEDIVNGALDNVLENMKARAQSIKDYECDEVTPAAGPNFPAELKSALEAVMAQAQAAETVAAKAEAAAAFSDIFQKIYEGKQAYVKLNIVARTLEAVESGNLLLLEKDEETGEWSETGNNLYNEDEITAIKNVCKNMNDAYYYSTYSTEQAKAAVNEMDPLVSNILPAKDDDDYYLISNPKQFAAYRAIASEYDANARAKLMNNIDMTGIAMKPIGHNKSGENSVHIYRGVLDGQGYALENVYINEAYTQGNPASLFYELKGATVKNFKLTGEYFNTEKLRYMGGITRWTSGNSTIENCEIAVVLHSFIEGDGTHGGIVGVSADSTIINNCIVNVKMIGEGLNPTTCCGGLVGWANSSPSINNILILSQYQNIARNDDSNVIGRNVFAASNVFYAESANPGFRANSCTLASEEQLASGEICWKLNADQSKINFYQSIGEDIYPTLNQSHGVVYAYSQFADNTVYYSNENFGCINTENQNISAGNSSVMEINVKNFESDLVGFQMDLTLPEGVSIDKTGCALSSRITDEDQELVIGKLENGNYRIMSTSLSLTPISGNDGTLLTLKLTAEDGCIGGQATISNILFSTSESKKIIMSDEAFDINVLYNLSYIVNGEEYKALSIPYGTTLTPESNLMKEGYTFSGWSEIPEIMPAKNVVVTGTLTINSYKLTYMVDGEEFKTISVVYGTTITPEVPTKEGYTFSGWSEIPETMPAKNVVVTGTFSVNNYKLTYMVDGEEYKTISVSYGTTITPEAPTKDGYTFGGWSEIPETMPAADVVITGRFYLYGDVNTDEEVDVVDVVDIARYVVATPSAWFRKKLADLNFDTIVNIADAVTLVNHIAGDQNFVKAMILPEKSYNYDRCQLQLLSAGQNALSLCMNGEADFTAFQFDIDVPEGIDISAVRFNGMRKDGHQLLYNKVDENRYRVTALSLSNEVFKGSEGELLQFSINGKPLNDICVHDIHFVTANGKDIIFESLYIDGNETGISDVDADDNNNVIYDLQGRKLSRTKRGVNIINGKKVVVNK